MTQRETPNRRLFWLLDGFVAAGPVPKAPEWPYDAFGPILGSWRPFSSPSFSSGRDLFLQDVWP